MPPTLPAVIVKSLKYLVSVLFYKFIIDSVVKNSNMNSKDYNQLIMRSGRQKYESNTA